MTTDELIEATARALAQADGIQICDDATYAQSSYRGKSLDVIAVIAPAVLDLAADEADVYGAWHFANDDGLSGFDKMHLAATEIADEIRALKERFV